MARVCSICSSEAKNEIDQALIQGVAIRRIAAQHSLAESSIRRHRDTHLRATLGKAAEERRFEIDIEALQGWIGNLQLTTLRLLTRAEDANDLPSARGLIREARENIALLGRVAGILEPNAAVSIDMRRQVAVLANLSEEELRALARGDQESDRGVVALPARAHEINGSEASG